MDTTDAKLLLEKYRLGTLSSREQVILESWYIKMAGMEAAPGISPDQLNHRLDRAWKNLPVNLERTAKKRKRLFKSFAIAATLIVVISAVLFTVQKPLQQPHARLMVNDALPGTERAILTLSNGRTIDLESVPEGKIIVDAGSTVMKTKNRGLQYEDVAGLSPSIYNTVSTPRGGQYHLELSDGTKVWLNAGSSLRFPVVFSGAERRVELSGEGYFEVAKNKAMPFLVRSAAQEIRVLGTHFNVNAYQNEGMIKTTLLEGSVILSGSGSSSVKLKPLQTAELKNNSFSVHPSDGQEALAWKNGVFYFQDAGITTIMRQIERWYDVKVEYRGEVKKELFTGKIPRNVKLSNVLRILEVSGVKFKIESGTVVINP